MSIDFDAVCFKCKKFQHIGQIMACIPSFGYGSKDIDGSNEAAKFALEHALECQSVMIMRADDVPEDFLYITNDPDESDVPGYKRGGVGE